MFMGNGNKSISNRLAKSFGEGKYDYFVRKVVSVIFFIFLSIFFCSAFRIPSYLNLDSRVTKCPLSVTWGSKDDVTYFKINSMNMPICTVKLRLITCSTLVYLQTILSDPQFSPFWDPPNT
jgi:hypothetical protein